MTTTRNTVSEHDLLATAPPLDPETAGRIASLLVLGVKPTASLPRMRIERGRVMHRVEPGGFGYRSMCRKPHPVLKDRTEPRANSHVENWTADNPLDYPNCTHCPTD